MKASFYCLVLISLVFIVLPSKAQLSRRHQRIIDKTEKEKSDKWPAATNTYEKGTVGDYLQSQFYKQCQYCGFIAKLESNRDYIPNDLNTFVRTKLLTTKAESMDINGSGFLKYIFHSNQINTKLDNIVASPTAVLDMFENKPVVNLVNRADFPAFMYSKNCVGIVKVAMDAKVEVPIASFKTAVNQDSKKESAIVVYEGWFVSPIFKVLTERSSSTTFLLSNLWNFYSQNIGYDNNSNYIKQFKGLTVGRTGSNVEYKNLEVSSSINASYAIASANFDANYGMNINNSFSGTDYQTLVYDVFDNNSTGSYKRTDMFATLPNSSEIIDYFNILKPSYAMQPGFELMAQSSEHTHYIEIEGIPNYMCSSNNWELKLVNKNSYKNTPILAVNQIFGRTNAVGCRYSIKGIPDDRYFKPAGGSGSVPIVYSIESTNKVEGKPLAINISTTFNTSEHPIPSLSSNNLKWQIEDFGGGKFRLKWKTIVNFTDNANPVDYTTGKIITCVDQSCKAYLGDKSLNVSATLSCNQNKQYELEIVYLDAINYSDVDLSGTALTLTFDGQFAIPLKAGATVSKHISGSLGYPMNKDIK